MKSQEDIVAPIFFHIFKGIYCLDIEWLKLITQAINLPLVTRIKKEIKLFYMYFCKIKSVSATMPRDIPHMLLIKILEKQ